MRVIGIGGRIMDEKRYACIGDFWASGSGCIEQGFIPGEMMEFCLHDRERIADVIGDLRLVFDSIQPLIVEMSYGFDTHGREHNGGWTRDYQSYKVRQMGFRGVDGGSFKKQTNNAKENRLFVLYRH